MGCKACCFESWRKSTLGSRECWEWQAALSLFSFSTSPSVWMSGTSHFPQRAACFLCYPTKQHPTLRTKADIPTGMQNNLAFFRIRFIVGSSFPVGHSSFSSSPPVNLFTEVCLQILPMTWADLLFNLCLSSCLVVLSSCSQNSCLLAVKHTDLHLTI